MWRGIISFPNGKNHDGTKWARIVEGLVKLVKKKKDKVWQMRVQIIGNTHKVTKEVCLNHIGRGKNLHLLVETRENQVDGWWILQPQC